MTPSLVRRFTEGDCHILAQAIHKATGWPIATFSYEGEPDAHAFVLMPDGHYLDIEGVRTADEMYEAWTWPKGEAEKWKVNHPIIHFDTIAELREADPGWTCYKTWPSSHKVAERVARKLLWHGHD